MPVQLGGRLCWPGISRLYRARKSILLSILSIFALYIYVRLLLAAKPPGPTEFTRWKFARVDSASSLGSETASRDEGGSPVKGLQSMTVPAKNARNRKFFLSLWTVVFSFSLLALGADHPSTPQGPAIHRAQLNSLGELQDDFFGDAVAVDGNTVVVGAWDATVRGNISGAAYVFLKPANGWANMAQTAELTASDDTVHFGAAVAISGDTIVIGAPWTTVNGISQQGALYVYVKPSGGWSNMTETAKLTGYALDNKGEDFLGSVVSIDGNTIVAGVPGVVEQFRAYANGEVFVYTKPETGWQNATETAVLYLNPLDYPEFGVGFGFSVGVSGNTVVVGATGCCVRGVSSVGQAWVFVEPPTGWATTDNPAGELTGMGVGANDSFAESVAIYRNTVVVGSPQQDSYQVGAAYVYVEPDSGWQNMTETAELYPIFTELGWFGWSVAINDNEIFIGAPFTTKTGLLGKGAAYAFVKPKNGWITTSNFAAMLMQRQPTNVEGGFEMFGQSVSIGGPTAVAGYSNSAYTIGGADVFWLSQ
jgi:hypothetical protein